ncbi:MAG: hypothetical protein ACPL7A_01180 [Anaerolineales bacterium]
MKSISKRWFIILIVLALSTLACKLLSPGAPTTEAPAVNETEIPMDIITEAPAEIPTEVPQSTSYIADVVMATDVDEETFEPINVTNTFSTSQSIFHCVVKMKNAPEDTNIRSVWSVVNVEGIEQGYIMGDSEVNGSGSDYVKFTFEPNSGSLPPGEYQVQILVNGVPDRVVSFTVQAQ